MWSNGTTLWVADYTDDKVYAYNLADGSRDTGNDISLNRLSTNIYAIASDGVTLWLSQGVTSGDASNKLWAYKKSGRFLCPVTADKDITLHYSSS